MAEVKDIILVCLLQYEDIMSSRFTLLGLYSLTNLKKFFVHLPYHYHCILANNDDDLFKVPTCKNFWSYNWLGRCHGLNFKKLLY